MRALKSFWWWFTSVMGDHDYERYVEHRYRQHPGEPLLTEREYWRRRHLDAAANPRSRCC